jgi:hypothetical protein
LIASSTPKNFIDRKVDQFSGNGESVKFDRSFDILVSGIETNVLKV